MSGVCFFSALRLHLSPDGICSLWRSTLEAPTSPTMMRGSVLAAPLTHNLHSLKRRLGHGQMDEKWKTIEETWRNMGRI